MQHLFEFSRELIRDGKLVLENVSILFSSDFQTLQPMTLEECAKVDFEWVEGSELAYM